ncbi:MAG TPA: sensor domain-containing diguanylate cyclase [Syntrophales bacterium]|nr:sensor domain-containing diguanylate cyclase [Syntrophales bacterium]
MNGVNEILQVISRNEEIAQKFFSIETSILSIHNFRDLFERLLSEITEKFSVPHVWITMTEDNDVYRLLDRMTPSNTFGERLKVIDAKAFDELIAGDAAPLLANEALERFEVLQTACTKKTLGSIAVVPLTYEGTAIGSLNLGDVSPDRYAEGMDASLLKQLAVKVSICLSNVMAHERLAMLAFRDPLTDLLNRRIMEQVLRREFDRARRYGTELAVVFLDIDRFKGINDRYGHDTGDEVLKWVGNRMCSMSRESDVVSRFAGDEFVIILPNTGTDRAYHFVDRLQTFFLSTNLAYDGKAIPVSLSCGIATMADAGITDAPSMLKKADERLYQSKNSKKE